MCSRLICVSDSSVEFIKGFVVGAVRRVKYSVQLYYLLDTYVLSYALPTSPLLVHKECDHFLWLEIITPLYHFLSLFWVAFCHQRQHPLLVNNPQEVQLCLSVLGTKNPLCCVFTLHKHTKMCIFMYRECGFLAKLSCN